MEKSHYSQFETESLILRDHLAVERTAMANERTLLSYVRTMIGLIAVGGSIMKLFDGWFYLMTGIFLIIFGLVTLIIGFVRYSRILIILREIYHPDADYKNSDWMHQTLWAVLEKLHLANIR